MSIEQYCNTIIMTNHKFLLSSEHSCRTWMSGDLPGFLLCFVEILVCASRITKYQCTRHFCGRWTIFINKNNDIETIISRNNNILVMKWRKTLNYMMYNTKKWKNAKTFKALQNLHIDDLTTKPVSSKNALMLISIGQRYKMRP